MGSIRCVKEPEGEILEKLAQITASARWLIDGPYGGTLAERLGRADTFLYLDYPIRLCVARLLKRIWTYNGRTRPDMTEGLSLIHISAPTRPY